MESIWALQEKWGCKTFGCKELGQILAAHAPAQIAHIAECVCKAQMASTKTPYNCRSQAKRSKWCDGDVMSGYLFLFHMDVVPGVPNQKL